MPSATNNRPSSSSTSSIPAPIPRDARLVALILASMGIDDCEPAVLIQLLEFAHKYTHDVLSDALVYADHASTRQGGTQVSLEDVQLAVQSRVNYSFSTPPPKEMLLSLADSLNRVPLPPISEGASLRLPPSNQCLTNVNFSIIPDELPERKSRNQNINSINQEQDRVETSNSNGNTNTNTNTRVVEDDDYDEEELEEIEIGNANANGSASGSGNNEVSGTSNLLNNNQSNLEQRGTKRTFEEDEDYD